MCVDEALGNCGNSGQGRRGDSLGRDQRQQLPIPCVLCRRNGERRQSILSLSGKRGTEGWDVAERKGDLELGSRHGQAQGGNGKGNVQGESRRGWNYDVRG